MDLKMGIRSDDKKFDLFDENTCSGCHNRLVVGSSTSCVRCPRRYHARCALSVSGGKPQEKFICPAHRPYLHPGLMAQEFAEKTLPAVEATASAEQWPYEQTHTHRNAVATDGILDGDLIMGENINTEQPRDDAAENEFTSALAVMRRQYKVSTELKADLKAAQLRLLDMEKKERDLHDAYNIKEVVIQALEKENKQLVEHLGSRDELIKENTSLKRSLEEVSHEKGLMEKAKIEAEIRYKTLERNFERINTERARALAAERATVEELQNWKSGVLNAVYCGAGCSNGGADLTTDRSIAQ